MHIASALGLGISLRKLLPAAELLGVDDICVPGCACDCREIEPGYLFAALEGTRTDGLQFLADAVARGAAAVLTDRPIIESPIPVCLVSNAREAYGRLCQALAGDPCRQLKVVGITGTSGKTTTACLIAGVLSAAGYRPGILGTIACFDGRQALPASHTTPPAHELAGWLSRMVANGCSHAVMEVSSHALDQHRAAGIDFDAACVTNVRRDHLDYHQSLLAYRVAKGQLLRQLDPEGFAVINADDPVAAGYLQQIEGPVLTVGIDQPAEITAVLAERFLGEQTFLLVAGSEAAAVRTRMIGVHHVYNCLVAAAVGLAYGIDLPVVVRGLESVESVPGRLERLDCGQPFGVFVDYAHTPDALTSALEALRAVTKRRLICVFGAGGDRDRQKRPLMARAVEAAADRAIVTTDNPRYEDPQSIAREVLGGFSPQANVRHLPDRAEAIAAALSEAQPGDCVLIAGKGHEEYQIVGDERLPLDDREVARTWLYAMQPQDPATNPRGPFFGVGEMMPTLLDLHRAIGGKLLPADSGLPRFPQPLGPVQTDSREMAAGGVFWALRGPHHDGTEFAAEAFRRGAAGAVVARGVTLPEGRWAIVADDTLAALWRWAAACRGQFRGSVIAVTGSVGKTTTRQMIHTVLRTRLNGIASPRNFNNQLGVPLSLLRTERGHDYAVLELGASRRGEIASLAGLCGPRIGVITCIGEAHLGTFGSVGGIAQAKAELLAALPPRGLAVLGDDPWLRLLAKDCPAPVTWVGIRPECDVRARDVRSTPGHLEFQLDGQAFRIPVWGRHHLTAALAAVAVGRTFGLGLPEMAEALADFQPVPLRCQVRRIREALIINDTYNSSPTAMRAALELLAEIETPGRRIVVCGDMAELGGMAAELHREIGRQVVTVAGADLLIACGHYARHVVSSARGAGLPPHKAVACDDVEQVLPRLGQAVQPGDSVLVKGSRVMAMERLVEALERYPLQRSA